MKKVLCSIEGISYVLNLVEIKSIVVVDDAFSYCPRNNYISGAKSVGTRVPYSSMTREQLLALPKREFERIHDVNALRKLEYTDLTPQQQRDVTQANKDHFLSSKKEVNSVLEKLQNCVAIHIMPYPKNNDFRNEIKELGGRVTDQDAYEIVGELTDEDYSSSTLSYLDYNWNALLMIFEFKGEHTFPSLTKGGDPVTVSDLDVYIKIDVDNETGDGYAAISFHSAEFEEMSHPYA